MKRRKYVAGLSLLLALCLLISTAAFGTNSAEEESGNPWFGLFPFLLTGGFSENHPGPLIDRIEFDKTSGGNVLTVYGSNFSSDPNKNTPIFSAAGSKPKVPGEVISASETQLKVEIPDQATTGPLFIDVDGNWSNQVQLGSASVQVANTTEESTSSLNNDSGGIPWFGMIPWLLTGSFTPQNDPPNAVISADPISGEAPLDVSFDASESADPNDDDLSYEWDFGDGASANGQNATHEFDTEGNYTVQLTVKDGRDGEDDVTTTIYVVEETNTETVDSSGGTVSTSKGSSVEIPPGVISEDTQVSVSDIAEPSPEFKSGTKSASNGTLITITTGETLESAQLSIDSVIQQSDQIGENDLITVEVPLENSSTISNSPPAIVEISSGDSEAKFIAPMEKTGSTAETVIPSSILKVNNGSNRTAVSTTPFVTNDEWVAPIFEGLYNANFNLVKAEDIDKSTIPIILIHGYKIAKVDEVIVKESESNSPIKESAEYLKTWNNFIRYAQKENLLENLKGELSEGEFNNFKLFAYRWDTDNGIEKAAETLKNEISQKFGERPFILLGHSAGGLVARATTEFYPTIIGDNVSGIITLASPHLGVPEPLLDVIKNLPWKRVNDDTLNDLDNDSDLVNKLNQDPEHNNKLIPYSGYFYLNTDIRSFPNFNKNSHSKIFIGSKLLMVWNHIKLGKNDGIVEVNSANLGRKESNPLYRPPLEDYDHLQMSKGRSDKGYKLYDQIASDLRDFVSGIKNKENIRPNVALKVENQNGPPPLTVDFDASGSSDEDGKIVSYDWEFGDGETGSGEEVSHTYTEPGTYTATVTVTDNDGATNQTSVQINVTSEPDLSVSSVESSKSTVQVGQNISVTFTVENTAGSIESSFKNRVFLSTSPYGGSGQQIPIEEFPMALNNNDSKTETVEVTIPSVPEGEWYLAVFADCNEVIDEAEEGNNIDSTEIKIEGKDNELPTASFTAEPTNGETPLDVSFDASDSSDPDGSINSYDWDFDDGSTGTGETTSHTYDSAGNYSVELTVTDKEGATSKDTSQVTVEASTTGDIKILNVTPDSGLTPGEKTSFTVEIEYSFYGLEEAILYIGFNTEEINEFIIQDEKIVQEKEGKHTFNGEIVTKDWGSKGDFETYVNISEHPHPDEWKPLAIDKYALSFSGTEEITFPDENLEQAIRDAIDKPSGKIYQSDLEGLTRLRAEGKQISDLSGLEYCEDLTNIWLVNNEIEDLTPLSDLNNLEGLYIGDNNINNLAPLSELYNLKNLYLIGNNISSLDSISGLDSLEHLNLSNNEITKINSLKDLHELKQLYLGVNNIENIDALASLSKLEKLVLISNNISSLKQLQNLENLKELNLNSNNISDIQPLVDNTGFSTGDKIDLQYNNLDLSEGSEDRENIQSLIDRGVEINYKPQK